MYILGDLREDQNIPPSCLVRTESVFHSMVSINPPPMFGSNRMLNLRGEIRVLVRSKRGRSLGASQTKYCCMYCVI